MKKNKKEFIFDKEFNHRISVDHSIHLIMATNPELLSEIDPFHLKKTEKFSRVRRDNPYVRPSKDYVKYIIEQTKSKKYIQFLSGVDFAPFKIIKQRWFRFDIGAKNQTVMLTYNLYYPDTLNVRFMGHIVDSNISLEKKLEPAFSVQKEFNDLHLNSSVLLTELIIMALCRCVAMQEQIPVYKRLNRQLELAVDTILKTEDDVETISIGSVLYNKKTVNNLTYQPSPTDILINVKGNLSVVLSLKNDVKIDKLTKNMKK